MAGFDFRFRESGGAPTVRSLVAKDNETFTKGDFVNVESGEADLAATADRAILGVVQETSTPDGSTDTISVITDDDAVYAYNDGTAHNIGASLDIRGATGAQALAASSNKDLVVVATTAATEETLVRINPNNHALAGTTIA